MHASEEPLRRALPGATEVRGRGGNGPRARVWNALANTLLRVGLGFVYGWSRSVYYSVRRVMSHETRGPRPHPRVGEPAAPWSEVAFGEGVAYVRQPPEAAVPAHLLAARGTVPRAHGAGGWKARKIEGTCLVTSMIETRLVISNREEYSVITQFVSSGMIP